MDDRRTIEELKDDKSMFKVLAIFFFIVAFFLLIGVIATTSEVSKLEVRVRILAEDNYELLVDKDCDVEVLILKVELLPDAVDSRQDLEMELVDQLRLKTNLRYNLEFHAYGTLPRYEVKAKRFKDLRK